MPGLTESTRISDVLFFEEGEEINYVRDVITVASGTVASAIGQVLGKVTATGKYLQVAPAGADGSQIAAAVLLKGFTATLGADTQFVAVVRGPAAVKDTGLVMTAAMTAPQIATAKQQLTAAGIKVQAAFGA